MCLSNRKKGFTLYELTIVILIIAMVSTLVVSFVTFLSNYSNTVKEDNNAMSEIYTYKVMMEKWFSQYDTADYEFSTNNTYGDTLTATYNGSSTPSYNAHLSGGYIYLEGYGSSGNTAKLTATYITSLTFTNYGSDDNLWRCTVGCDSGDVTFLLERHVGYSN